MESLLIGVSYDIYLVCSSVQAVHHPFILCGLAGSCRALHCSHGLIIQVENHVPQRMCVAYSNNARQLISLNRTGLHNISHPRTDAVVIMAVLNEANDKILLGRNVSQDLRFYFDRSIHSHSTFIEKMGNLLLFCPRRIHRARRVARRCCKA